MSFQLFGEEKEPFITVSDGYLLTDRAREAKSRYDEFLERYAGYLEEKRDGLTKAISGKVAK